MLETERVSSQDALDAVQIHPRMIWEQLVGFHFPADHLQT